MAKILVTGGAGFIGSHVVDQLIEKGHSVTVIDDLSSGLRENLPIGVTLHELDVRLPEARVAIRKTQPDVIVHMAAQISVRVSMEDPGFDTAVNVGGVVNILQAANDCKQSGGRLPHIVFISTGGAIYGEQEAFPATEDHPIRPESVYGLAKRVGEMYLELWSRQFGLTYCALRLSNVYGPRQNPHGEAGVVAIFCERLLRGELPTINGTGEQTRDFIYVEDVARAVLAAATKRTEGVFNIGTAREVSVNQVYSAIAAGLEMPVDAPHGPVKGGEQQRSCIDPGRAFADLGWEPQVGLADGLARTAVWFKIKSSAR